MKKLIHIALLLISFTAFAQNKFIEVEVTDTITLKPISFQVNLVVDDVPTVQAYELEDNVAVELAGAEDLNNKQEELKKLLVSKKYTVKPLDESKMNIFERRFSNNSLGYSVPVSSLVEAEKLKELVKNMAYVKTTVSVLKYEDEQVAEELLIKRLMDKAKRRAMVIGANTGLKAGKVLEVKEGQPKDAMGGMMEFYEQIAKMGAMGKDTGNYTGSLSKTLVVKFAAE